MPNFKIVAKVSALVVIIVAGPLHAQKLVPFRAAKTNAVTENAHIVPATGGLVNARNHIVSSNAGPTPFTGLSINELIGAQRFYDEGYTGTRAVIVNVEGGHVWNQHETLGLLQIFFDARQTFLQNGLNFGQLGEFDRHATWVGHNLGGFDFSMLEYELGVAYGAQMWSGAIANNFIGDPFTLSWSWDRGYSFTDAFSKPLLSGSNGVTADVSNSSWGFTNSQDSSITGGNNLFTVTLDGIARQSGATVVCSAGNDGPKPNTIGGPGNGYNTICVGASGDDLSSEPFSLITDFSSRGPQNYNGPDGEFGLVRARIDIVAPGANLTLAFYGGLTGGNAGGEDVSNGQTSYYSFNVAGTSFSAPTVAAAAALIADVAYDQFSENVSRARNGQVVKSVLLNSARKPEPWDNGQSTEPPFVTSQALDYTYGAGLLDLDKAFDQFTTGNTDLPGDGPGMIETIGWDFGVLPEGASAEYLMFNTLTCGSEFTATLNWFVGRTWVETANTGCVSSEDLYFTDLALEMYRVKDDQPELVAQSDAKFINTEHLHFEIPTTGQYMLKVNWVGERYDFVDNDSQTFALAWRTNSVLLGDINGDGTTDLLDVGGFIELLTNSEFAPEADINKDGAVDLLDIVPFIEILSG